MPNWTYNEITIKGNKETLNKIMNDAKLEDGKLTFTSWLEYPQTYLDYDTTNYPNGDNMRVGEVFSPGLQGAKHAGEVITEELIEEYKEATKYQLENYGVVGWYDFNRVYFGCKWNSEINSFWANEEELVLTCDTPWTAPDAFLHKMSERYPEVVFSNHAIYEDGYWGDTDYEAGEITYDDEGVIYEETEDEEE